MNGIERVGKVSFPKHRCKTPIGWEQDFLLAAGQIQVRWLRFGRQVRDDEEGIVLPASDAAHRAEGTADAEGREGFLPAEAALGHIECAAEAAGEGEELRMLQRENDGAVAA